MDFSAPFVESLVNLISSFELLFKFGIDSSITFISLNTVVPLSFSNNKKENIININPDFLEWFRGFTDAFKFLRIKQFSTKRSTINNNNLSLVE